MSAGAEGDVTNLPDTSGDLRALSGDLRELIDGVGVVLGESDARTGRFTFVSRHAEVLLGYPATRWGEPEFWASIIHPDDREQTLSDHAGAADHELHYRAVAADGRLVWLHQLSHVVAGSDGSPQRWRNVLIDVSSRRVSEDRDRFLSGLELELQSLEDAEEIMALVARRLGEHIGADRCAYARAETDDDHFVMSGDYATGLPNLPGRFAMSAFGSGCLSAMRAGEPWVVADSGSDDRLEPADLAAYRTTGIRAVICVPLHKSGRFVAAMAVHQATARHWTQDVIDLVAVVVNRCWESVQRTHSGRALRDSEQRYRLLVERATDGIWILDHDLRFVDVNQAACELLGYDRVELLGRTVTDLVVSDQSERLRDLVTDPSAVQVLTEVWDVRRADGTVVALELSIQTTPTGLQAIGRDVTARRRVEAERELLLQREHAIAEALQRSLLPRELPALERLAAAARYLPASLHAQTGGDWYEFLPISGSVVALSVGDVVGKGPTAAAVMGQLRSALAGYLLDGHSPAAALQRLDGFVRRTPGAAGTTCACLTFDWRTGELSWAVAGHPPPLVVDGGQPRFLTGAGPVLGMPQPPGYRDATTTMTPGACVLLYTDGLVERRGAVLDTGLARLSEVVERAHHLDPDALAGAVTDDLLAEGHDDDVALLVVRHIPERLCRRVPAVPQEVSALRRHVGAWAAAAGLPADLRDDLQLSIGEAVANSVEHAYLHAAGDVEYELARTARGGVHAVVRDQGRWRPVPADNGTRGRGLSIIHALADTVDLRHGDDGTTIEFHLLSGSGAEQSTVELWPLRAGTDLSGAFRITGDLDLTTVREVRAALLGRIAAAPEHSDIDVDLTGLVYLSSSGVALLLEAAESAARTATTLTVLTTAGSAPARILALSGFQNSDTTLATNLVVRTFAPAPATTDGAT